MIVRLHCTSGPVAPYQDYEVTQGLLEAGIDPQAPQKDGKTPLHLLVSNKNTISKGDLEKNITLLAVPSPNPVDNSGSTPLHDLCSSFVAMKYYLVFVRCHQLLLNFLSSKVPMCL
jgi:hypothetical protein